MDTRHQVLVLLDEYASGERPRDLVADDIMSLIHHAFRDGEQAGNVAGFEQADVGLGEAYEKGYEDGNINGYSDAMCEIKDKKEQLLKLIGELYA